MFKAFDQFAHTCLLLLELTLILCDLEPQLVDLVLYHRNIIFMAFVNLKGLALLGKQSEFFHYRFCVFQQHLEFIEHVILLIFVSVVRIETLLLLLLLLMMMIGVLVIVRGLHLTVQG